MPQCFRKDFPDCRVVVDCTEIKCEKPKTQRQRNVLWSNYKSDHTVKFMIGNYNKLLVNV